MATALPLGDQAALDLHKIMLEAMRARESEILRFIGFFLTAIVGFIAAIGWLIDKEKAVYAEELIPALFAIIILILFFGAWYALALSYNYRYIQLSTWFLQDHLNVTQFQPNWKPKKFQPDNLKDFNFAPEILRTQLWLFIALIIAAVVFLLLAFILFVANLRCLPLYSLFYLGVCLEAFWFLWKIHQYGFCVYPKKYNKLHDEVSEKYITRLGMRGEQSKV